MSGAADLSRVPQRAAHNATKLLLINPLCPERFCSFRCAIDRG